MTDAAPDGAMGNVIPPSYKHSAPLALNVRESNGRRGFNELSVMPLLSGLGRAEYKAVVRQAQSLLVEVEIPFCFCGFAAVM